MFKNKHIVEGDITKIYWTNRKRQQFEILVDTEDLNIIKSIGYSLTCMLLKNNMCYYPVFVIYKGTINNKPKYKIVYLHRLITKARKNEYVDHINHNTLDNRKSNLRLAKNKQNLKNRNGKNKNNSTGYRNVSWIEEENIYVVQLQIDGKNTRLGKFTDVHEAGAYAEKMRKKHYKEFAGKN